MWSWLRRIFTGKDQPPQATSRDTAGAGGRPPFVGAAEVHAGVDRRDASSVITGQGISPPPPETPAESERTEKSEEPFKPDATPELVTDVPPWGVPLGSPERINFFSSLVFRYFNLRKIPMRMEQGVVETLEHDARDQAAGASSETNLVSPSTQGPSSAAKPSQPSRMRYGLWNIMQTCAGADRSEWAGLIAAHFDTVRRAPDVELRYSDRLASFEGCKDHLCVRVFDEAHLPEPLEGEAYIRRPAPGLMSVIVVDFPESCRSLRRVEAQPWNVPESLLWSTAERNISTLARAEVQRLGPDDEPGLMVLTGDSIYVASMIHRLDDTPQMTGALGTLVSLPVRHAVLTLPIDDASSIRALAPMIGMTVQLERAGPGSVSGRVYFRSAKPVESESAEAASSPEAGRWSELKYALDGRSVEIIEAPDALAALLEELGTPRSREELDESDSSNGDGADSSKDDEPQDPDADDLRDDDAGPSGSNDSPPSPPSPPTRPAP